jgi:glycosyltransferase involved in cell wall biosynthesis
MANKNKIKVLLYSMDGYSTFFTNTKFIFGGIEKETAFHAKGLSQFDDLEIIVVTKNQAEKDGYFNKIKIVQHPFIYGQGYWAWRNSLLGRIQFKFGKNRNENSDCFFCSINPDVVFCMGLQNGSAELLEYCRKNNKKLIFKIAHDNEVLDKTLEGQGANGMIDGIFSAFGKYSSVVLCQTPLQYKLLKERYGIIGKMHFNPIDLKVTYDINKKKFDLFWVGRSTKFKRPEIFIELCAKFPNLKACMVLNVLDMEYWNSLTTDLPKNITLIESIPADKIDCYFAWSKIFVSTSDSEGFANTYLQAAKHSVPIVSMCCDPNGMLSAHKAGVLTGDSLENLEKCICEMVSNYDWYKSLSLNARNYVETFHDSAIITQELREFILN